MVYFRGRGGVTFTMAVRAARLVDARGTSRLPPPYGTLETRQITRPNAFGLAAKHPLQDRYSSMELQYQALVVPEDWMVERAGRRGLALYVDYNGSGLCASITSENGRNGLAPFDWEGEPGSPTDPTAKPHMEWREVPHGDQVHCWQNYLRHGTTPGLDWRDGVPSDLATMYDSSLGTVVQSVLVPTFYQGMGTAEQTMATGDVTDFYSIVVFFPRDTPEVKRVVEQFTRRSAYESPYFPYSGSYGVKGLEALGGGAVRTRGGVVRHPQLQQSAGPEESYGGDEAPEAELKMSAGGKIRQSFPYDPFGPSFWEPQPQLGVVFIPITAATAQRLFPEVGAVRGRQTF